MNKVELELKDHSAWVWFNDPKGLNTIDDEYLDQLDDVLNRITKNPKIRAVVFATNDKHFSVGLDLKKIGSGTSKNLLRVATKAGQVFLKVYKLKVPTLALFRGYTVGGAIEMCAGCDFRFAADNTKISVPGVKIGIFNPAQTSYKLSRLIGLSRAKELMMNCRTIDAQTSLAWGLVSEIHPENNLLKAGEDWVNQILSFEPMALELTKKLLNSSFDLDQAAYDKLEKKEMRACFDRKQALNLIKNFLNK